MFILTPLLPASAALSTAESATGYIKVWSGSAWVLKPVKYWDGSAWVIKPLKYYNGSTWVAAPAI